MSSAGSIEPCDGGRQEFSVANDNQNGILNWLPYREQSTHQYCPGECSNLQTRLVPTNRSILPFGYSEGPLAASQHLPALLCFMVADGCDGRAGLPVLDNSAIVSSGC